MFHLESYCFGPIEAETKFVKKKYGVLDLDSLLADFQFYFILNRMFVLHQNAIWRF